MVGHDARAVGPLQSVELGRDLGMAGEGGQREQGQQQPHIPPFTHHGLPSGFMPTSSR